MDSNDANPTMDLLMEIPLRLGVELASCSKSTQEVLQLKPGAVVQFGPDAKAPVNLFVNKTLVAEGEIVETDGVYGIRITRLAPAAAG